MKKDIYIKRNASMVISSQISTRPNPGESIYVAPSEDMSEGETAVPFVSPAEAKMIMEFLVNPIVFS